MSSTTTTPSPNDLTRQQLDELDALLQRMLSLPLSTPPTPVPAVLPAPSVSLPAGWRADAPPAPRPPYMTIGSVEEAEELLEQVAAMAAPVTTAAFRPAEPPPAPVPHVVEPPARMFSAPTPDTGVPPSAGPLRGVDAPALPSGYRPTPEQAFAPAPVPAPLPEPSATEEPLAELTPVAPPARPAAVETSSAGRVPVVLWPMFAVNWVLELFLGLLGPVGAFVTYPAVKHLLGVAGLGLLAGAGAWAVRGMGWVAW